MRDGTIKLGKLLSLEYGKSLPKKNRSGDGFPVHGSNGEVGRHHKYLTPGPGVVVGRKGSHGEVTWVDDNFFPIDTTYYVKTNDIDMRYAYYLLQSVDLKSLNRSTAIPGLNRNDAYAIDVPLHSELERGKITSHLDSFFTRHAVLQSAVSRLPELLADFRAAVLHRAVTGELIGKDFRIEYAPVTIKDICEPPKYGTSSKSELEGDVPVLRMGNLQSGEIDYTNLKYTSDLDEIEKYNLQSGDLLFNRTNSPELVGKTSIYRGNKKAIYAGYLIRLRPLPKMVRSEYLNYVLNSLQAKAWAREVKTDGVSQSNINAAKLKAFTLHLPPPEDQDVIVKKVEALFIVAGRLEAKIKTLNQQVSDLPQAVLAKVFEAQE